MTTAWLVVFLAVFLIGLTKSGFGSGVGLMIVPMAAIALGHIPSRGSEAALGLLLPLLIGGDLIAVWQYRGLLRRPAPPEPCPEGEGEETGVSVWVIKRLLPGTAVGVALGGLLLWWFHQQPPKVLVALIRAEIGFESVLLVGIHWWRQWRGLQHALMPEPLRSHFTGAFAGISSTLAHAAGPIIAMYLLPLKPDRRVYVGACAVYFFMLNTAKLPAYYLADQFAHAELSFTVRFLPLVLAGAFCGLWLNRHMSDSLFSKLVYFITFVLGWYMLADGLRMLVR